MTQFEIKSLEGKKLSTCLVKNMKKRFYMKESPFQVDGEEDVSGDDDELSVNELELETMTEYSIATMLHPCYKTGGFKSKYNAERARAKMIEMLEEVEECDQSNQNVLSMEVNSGFDFDLFALIHNDVGKRTESKTSYTIKEEVDFFLHSPLETNKQVDIFAWWYSRRDEFKRLYKLAESF
jgi:hypothetical protein